MKYEKKIYRSRVSFTKKKNKKQRNVQLARQRSKKKYEKNRKKGRRKRWTNTYGYFLYTIYIIYVIYNIYVCAPSYQAYNIRVTMSYVGPKVAFLTKRTREAKKNEADSHERRVARYSRHVTEKWRVCSIRNRPRVYRRFRSARCRVVQANSPLLPRTVSANVGRQPELAGFEVYRWIGSKMCVERRPGVRKQFLANPTKKISHGTVI